MSNMVVYLVVFTYTLQLFYYTLSNSINLKGYKHDSLDTVIQIMRYN